MKASFFSIQNPQRCRQLQYWFLVLIAFNVLLQFDFTERWYNQHFPQSVAQAQLQHQAFCGSSFARDTSRSNSLWANEFVAPNTSNSSQFEIKPALQLFFAIPLSPPTQTHFDRHDCYLTSQDFDYNFSGLSPPRV